MKKFCVLIFAIIFCCLPLTACNKSNNEIGADFIADEQHCVVSLPQDYDISFDNDEVSFDVNLYNAKTVNGKPKKEGFVYYKVLKNAPFRILTPRGIIQDKNTDGQTLVYWKLNDTLYKDGDNYYSANTFTCAKDTEISPVYYEFRAVGMLLLEAGENVMPNAEQYDQIFDDNGNIKEQNGVHYLYGVYDFEPYQNFWRTDLTLNKFVINHTVKAVAENYSKEWYTLNIEIDKGNLFDKGKIIVKTLYKIEGHGYMTYGFSHIINGDDAIKMTHTLPVGKHELKYTFTQT